MRADIHVRFWSKVDGFGDCWLWTGERTSKGYGRFHAGDRQVMAHRFAYEDLIGSIPVGLTIDHLCRVRHCVNPAHLEPVTNTENIRRGMGWGGTNVRKTHCYKGHPYDEVNTRRRRDGSRECKTCMSLSRHMQRTHFAPGHRCARGIAP